MKGFKDSTRTKYECGGRVMKQAGGAIMPPAGTVTKQPITMPTGGKPMTGAPTPLPAKSKPAPRPQPARSAAPAKPAMAAKPAMRKAHGGAVGNAKPVKKADGGAVGRANSQQAREAREEAKLLREVPARPTRGNRPNYNDEPAADRAARAAARTARTTERTAERTARDTAKATERTARTTERTAERTARMETPRGPAGQGFRVQPMYEVNNGPSSSGMQVLRGLEGAARAVLPDSMERGAERYGMLPRRQR
jgi:hypothetical protein